MFGKNRVEEDLERIRHANLPQKYPKPKKAESEEHFGAKDVLAMIIAVFSIALPYVLVFVAIMGLVMWGITAIF